LDAFGLVKYYKSIEYNGNTIVSKGLSSLVKA